MMTQNYFTKIVYFEEEKKNGDSLSTLTVQQQFSIDHKLTTTDKNFPYRNLSKCLSNCYRSESQTKFVPLRTQIFRIFLIWRISQKRRRKQTICETFLTYCHKNGLVRSWQNQQWLNLLAKAAPVEDVRKPLYDFANKHRCVSKLLHG